METGIISLNRIQHADAVRFMQYLKNSSTLLPFTCNAFILNLNEIAVAYHSGYIGIIFFQIIKPFR